MYLGQLLRHITQIMLVFPYGTRLSQIVHSGINDKKVLYACTGRR